MKNLLSIALVLLCSYAHSQGTTAEKIVVTGIVVHAAKHAALDHVSVSYNDKQIAETDSSGFFRGEIVAQLDNSPVTLTLNKRGYDELQLKERWHPLNFRKGINIVAGLAEKMADDLPSFIDAQPGELSSLQTWQRVDQVIAKQHFDDGLAQLRKGNDTVLFTYQGACYILSNSSWLKTDALKDSIIINDGKKIEVGEINRLLKRSQIKGMTPDAKEANVLRITTY